VVDGHHLDALVEVVHGITTLSHHRLNEAVGLCHRLPGLVDETLLRLQPLLCVRLARRGFEVADLQGATSLDAPAQLGLGAAAVTLLVDQPVILRSEPFLQRPRPQLWDRHHGDDEHYDNGQHHKQPGHE
jgi:hypothetical protein